MTVRKILTVLVLSILTVPAFGATFTGQRVSKVNPGNGCTDPPSTQSFLTTDGTVYLYFYATTTTADYITSDWLAPDGTIVSGGNWSGRVSGTYCYTGESLNIDPNTIPSRLGGWTARVYNNGLPFFTVSFGINGAGGGSNSGNSSGIIQKPVPVRDYDRTYDGVAGTGTVGYRTLYRDNEDNGVTAGCNGEGCGRHPAVDIPVQWDTPVHAIANGVIASVPGNLQGGYNGGWGGLVILEHNSLPGTSEPVYSAYAHLNRFEPGLVIGKQVSKNDIIGYSGGTGPWAGRSTGNHLHFQLNRRTLASTGIGSQLTIPWFPSLSDLNARDDDDRVDLYTYSPILFIENANGVAPILDSLDTTSVPSNVPATINLSGNNFDTAASKVVVVTTSGEFVGYAAVFSRSDSQLQVQVVMNNQGVYLIGVRNPDGRMSGYRSFSVTANGATGITSRDQQAQQDMIKRASQDHRFGSVVPGSFGVNLNWGGGWELRWLGFDFSNGRSVSIFHATATNDATNRWVEFYDPDLGAYTGWQRP